MPRAAHTLLTWKGTFGTLADTWEEWQFGLRCGWDPAGLTEAPAQQIVANALVTAWQTNLAGVHPGHVFLRTAEYRRIGPDGKQLKDALGGYVGRASNNGPHSGTGVNTPVLPPQCAAVVSLGTSKAGARGKGRVFLPTLAGALGADLRLTPTIRDNALSAFRGFVEDLEAAVGTERIRVYSSDGTPGALVTQLRMGRAVDTQRRRRGDMLETYATLAPFGS